MDRYQLGQVFAPADGPSWRVRQGKLVSIQSDYTATVTIAGSDTEVPDVRYVGAPPKPGGGVWLMTNGTDVFITGALASVDGTIAPRVYRTANQSITNASATPLQWQADNSDAYGCFLTSASQQVLIGIPGRYSATTQVDFASNATGVRSASIIVNGSTVVGAQRVAAYTGVAHLNVQSLPFTVSSTASVTLWVEQNSGGALDVVASGSVSPGLAVYYLGP